MVETDHKPLESIVNKDINKISCRLQRMVLKLLKYNIEVRYVPGHKMFIADYLSRHYIMDNAKIDPTVQELVHSFEQQLAVTDKKMAEFQKETLNDPDLRQVITWYNEGYPKNDRKIASKNLSVYYKLRSELHVKDNIIYYNDRIVVPQNMKQGVLKSLHTGHVGAGKCKKRARNLLYWPGMSVDIEKFIFSCNICEKYRVSKPKDSLMSHEIPDLPFFKIGMDICTYGTKDYIVVVDYYSRWIEVKMLKDKTAGTVIQKLKLIFAVHGFPKVIVCDNMPFASYTFKQFAESYDIQLVYSSPRYPQSNGLSEKAVGIVKNMMRKC